MHPAYNHRFYRHPLWAESARMGEISWQMPDGRMMHHRNYYEGIMLHIRLNTSVIKVLDFGETSSKVISGLCWNR